MKRFVTLAIILSLGAFLIFIAGCDSDPESSGLQEGSLDDPNYELVDDIFGEGFVGFNSQMLGLSMALADSIPGQQGPAKLFASSAEGECPFAEIEFSYTWDNVNYWHIFNVAAYAEEEIGDGSTNTYSYEGIDSIRFENVSGPMQYPDETTTNMKIRWHFGTLVTADTDEIEVTNDASLDLTGEYEGDFTVNGSSTDSLDVSVGESQSTCIIAISSVQSFTDVEMDEAARFGADCPASGRMDIDATIAIECEGTGGEGEFEELSITGDWDISYVFDSTGEARQVTITFIDGTTRWVNTVDCEESELDPVRVAKALRNAVK